MKAHNLLMCEHYRTCPDFTNQNISCSTGPHAKCKEANLYGPPKSLDFQVFICPTMGAVSPKACSNCRPQQEGHCPLGKKEATEAGW